MLIDTDLCVPNNYYCSFHPKFNLFEIAVSLCKLKILFFCLLHKMFDGVLHNTCSFTDCQNCVEIYKLR